MIVNGEGPIPARVMLIGEYPGKDEGILGRPFVGRSGQLLDAYFGRHGVPMRDDVYLTNVGKEYLGHSRGLPDAEIEKWLPWLCAEIAAVQPEVIVTLGRTALRVFLDLDMEAAHGIGYDVPVDRIFHPGVRQSDAFAADRIRLFACYNPAAALRNPTMFSLLTYDVERLGQYLRGALPSRDLDADAKGTYTEETAPSTLYSSTLGLDTEGYLGAPWGLSYSDAPERGRVVRAHASRVFRRLLQRRIPFDPPVDGLTNGYVWRQGLLVYLHHALHDLPVLREMGIDLDAIPGCEYRDTMVMAYLLGLEPQALKSLAYRHCGMSMREYLDLASVSEERIARTWLLQVYDALPVAPPKIKKSKTQPLLPDAIDPMTLDLMKARTLIGKMLEKPTPIRKRWSDCRAYEILDEQALDVEMPVPSLDDVIADHGGDPTAVIDYVGADADATRRLGPILEKQIDAYGLRDCFTVTNSIIPMIDRMQSVGILGDADHFRGLIPIFEGEGRVLDLQIAETLGYAINANSPDQVQAALFEKLRLHKRPEARHIRFKRTEKGKYSTDDKALRAIEGLHPIVALVQERREITKLLGSYVYPILDYLKRSPDGRLRCELLLTRTDTGRLAAKRPNLLAWPKHSARGKLIRYGFRAAPGKEFGAWDLDQIEMKVFADNANETAMLAAFLSGRDLHVSTAAMLVARSYEEILHEYKETKRLGATVGTGDEQRFAAKAVNFGELMGITEFGLLAQFHKNKQLHMTLEGCAQLLVDWAAAYPEGAAYQKEKHREARQFGYVRDMFGRLRWLEGVRSEDAYLREEAERMAQATPVQSGAQGIMQRAMRDLWPVLRDVRDAWGVEPLLQTHDELLFEYNVDRREEMDLLVTSAMANAVQLKVPVTSKGSFGQNWGAIS